MNTVTLKKLDLATRKDLIKRIGIVYTGYIIILLDTLQNNNIIDVEYLKKFVGKTGRLDVIRKLTRENIIKKQGTTYFLNPIIATLDNDPTNIALTLFII